MTAKMLTRLFFLFLLSSSVKLLYASSVCEIYKERDCKGKSSSWVWSDGADNGTCLNTADKEWQGGRSFRCYIGKN